MFQSNVPLKGQDMNAAVQMKNDEDIELFEGGDSESPTT